MADKIRLGIIGASIGTGWASRAHLPAVVASPEYELTAVCTTKPESAEESRRKYGAKLAFHDYKAMVASPYVDAVSVVVRVPSHYGATKAALAAGKHVYTEWPLGRTTSEAEELAALAEASGVQTTVGLQSRVDPAVMYLKELIATGYVGEVMACHVSLVRDGSLRRPSNRTWQRDVKLGANTLTIAGGHTIDALRFVTADFSRLASVVSTQAREWSETDTRRMVDVTAPDNVLVAGHLANGAVASVHVASVLWAGSGYRMEIYGREGTLVATSNESPQLNEVRLQGARGGNELQPLEVPSRFVYVGAGMPKGAPYNVGQMYHQFAQGIRTGQGSRPTFETAVELHRIIDTIKSASDTGQAVSIER